MPNLDLNEEMTSDRMLWGLPFSLGGARIEALVLAADSGAAVTVVAESSICRSLRLESCKYVGLVSALCGEEAQQSSGCSLLQTYSGRTCIERQAGDELPEASLPDQPRQLRILPKELQTPERRRQISAGTKQALMFALARKKTDAARGTALTIFAVDVSAAAEGPGAKLSG